MYIHTKVLSAAKDADVCLRMYQELADNNRTTNLLTIYRHKYLEEYKHCNTPLAEH